MSKKKAMVNAIEPRNDELIGLIKKYIFLEFDDEEMISAILTESGELITRDQLKKWKAIAKREKRDSKIEIDEYLTNMIEVGMFEDVKRQYEISKDMMLTNYKTYKKVTREGDVNKQVALTSVMSKQMDDMRKLVTSMGYMVKTKEILDRGFKSGLADDSGTSIQIESKPSDSFDDVVDHSISELELKDNEVF